MQFFELTQETVHCRKAQQQQISIIIEWPHTPCVCVCVLWTNWFILKCRASSTCEFLSLGFYDQSSMTLLAWGFWWWKILQDWWNFANTHRFSSSSSKRYHPRVSVSELLSFLSAETNMGRVADICARPNNFFLTWLGTTTLSLAVTRWTVATAFHFEYV